MGAWGNILYKYAVSIEWQTIAKTYKYKYILAMHDIQWKTECSLIRVQIQPAYLYW